MMLTATKDYSSSEKTPATSDSVVIGRQIEANAAWFGCLGDNHNAGVLRRRTLCSRGCTVSNLELTYTVGVVYCCSLC